jgi:hypothetical protein
VLAVGTPGLSPATIEVYSVDGAAATLRGAVTGSVSDVNDLALTPDGATLVAAFGSPYQHIAYDSGTLAELRRYGDPNDFWGYPNNVAISADGVHLAAGRYGGVELTVHKVADGTMLSRADGAAGDLVPHSVAFLGADVFGVLNNWQAGTFFLWRVAGATLRPRPSS